MTVYGLHNGSQWWRHGDGMAFHTVYRGVAVLQAQITPQALTFDLDCTKIGTTGPDGKRIDHVHGVPHRDAWQVKIIGPDGQPVEEEQIT